MIISYRDRGTKDIAEGQNTKAARKSLPQELHDKARQRLSVLDVAESALDLNFSALGYEQLGRKRPNDFSIRINNQYRVVFQWEGSNVRLVGVEDYHDNLNRKAARGKGKKR